MQTTLQKNETLTNNSRDNDAIDFSHYINIVFDNKWLILIVTVFLVLSGGAYALLASPVFESNISVQVEDSASSSKNVLGDLSSMFDLKTAATAEIEILRSRLVVAKVVTARQLDIILEPKYFPIIGRGLARYNGNLSSPGILGFGGYVWGSESAVVSIFEIPTALKGKKFVLTVLDNGQFSVMLPSGEVIQDANVGELIKIAVPEGIVELKIASLNASKGAKFTIKRLPQLAVVQALQSQLAINEKGKQSGIISVTLNGEDPQKTADTLNELAQQYLSQNIARKSEEAEKSLQFIEQQLPIMKANLEAAEEKYSSFRNSQGTVDLTEEAKTLLQQSVAAQTRLIELKQQRDELLTRYQSSNPVLVAIESQIQTLKSEADSVAVRIKRMPAVEQSILRLIRDVKVNTDLYAALLNSTQQLRLLKASKVGNARLIDTAEFGLEPIRPRRPIIFFLSAIAGLALGIVCALIRGKLYRTISDPSEIENVLGLQVTGAIPTSKKQQDMYAEIQTNPTELKVLACEDSSDLAIESLRSLRTSLQFSMATAKNNIVVITGTTPGVGKSFVAANLAALLASTGKKVLLVDGDLRKGYLQKYFGCERENGLAEILTGTLQRNRATHREIIENLDFISTGELPQRPAELLTQIKLAEFLTETSGSYDVVLIDTPPVLAVTDALVIAPHAGAVLNVVRGKITTIGEIAESAKRLHQVGANLTGIVFNCLVHQVGPYGYGSRYGAYQYAQYKY